MRYEWEKSGSVTLPNWALIHEKSQRTVAIVAWWSMESVWKLEMFTDRIGGEIATIVLSNDSDYTPDLDYVYSLFLLRYEGEV